MESTTMHEDNNAYIAHLKEGYIKDLFTKFLPRRILEQLVHKIGLRHLRDESLGRNRRTLYQRIKNDVFFLLHWVFIPKDFS